jgi:ferredoxin|tara:strand:+ start:153 stop:353 length:201 start_codon:yes stop_codon:yes gene_type:complete
MIMKVSVDMELCEANALCVMECPEVFQLTDDDKLILLKEHPGEELRAKVEAAAQLCPRLAITVTDD